MTASMILMCFNRIMFSHVGSFSFRLMLWGLTLSLAQRPRAPFELAPVRDVVSNGQQAAARLEAYVVVHNTQSFVQ